MQAFARKLRESRRPGKTVYFYNIERCHWDERPECCHRWHHHLVVSGDVDLEAIREMWGRGLVLEKRLILDADHTFGALASYLLKESSEFPGKRGWRCSRGLQKPEVDTIIVPDDYELQAPESEGVMVLENQGPQLTVYGKFQTLKFQTLDRYESPVISSKYARRKRRNKQRAATHGAD